jgi:hypothetical protein
VGSKTDATHYEVDDHHAQTTRTFFTRGNEPSAQSLTRSALFLAQSTPLPLHTLLGVFPSLSDLDISDVLNPKATLFSPLDTLTGVPTEILMLLKFARDQTAIQRLTIRFPKKREILRCWRVGDDEAEKGSYGFARELWREW